MSLARMSRPPALLVAAAALLAGGVLAAAPAQAVTVCDPTDIKALKVPDVLSIDAASVNATTGACIVTGKVKTHGFGAPDGSAQFKLTLPATWNQKFVQFGQGGFAGTLSVSANAADSGVASGAGYASAVTDTGHQAGSTDARWALISPGVPDEAKLTDYYFRAVHQVAEASKELVRRYYGSPLRRAYFDGCSNGGRQAMVEATKFPDDFDGIVSGDPFMDIRSILSGASFNKIQLASADVFIPAIKLPMVDAAVYNACDKLDGVADHLIQNPAKCSFDPKTLVTPSCTGSNPSCLTSGEANTLQKYLTALRDDDGNIVYTGQTISDLEAGPQGVLDASLGGMDFWTTGLFLPGQPLPPPATGVFDLNAAEPWDNSGFTPSPIGWQFADHFIQYVVERDPTFDLRSYVHKAGQVNDFEVGLFDRRSEAGDGDIPEKLLRFIEKGKKLVIYHGMSDPALAATRTIKYYEDLADTAELSFAQLQEHVRLFLVPGMHHCTGGPGPNFFDTLTPLDNWVDQGIEPDAIIATHFKGNIPINPPPAPPGPTIVERTMPLCKFPEEAVFKGMGSDVSSAANWSCQANDRRMLEVGANGKSAGLNGDRMRERDEDDHGHDDDHGRD
ncbi:MAG TPA: tannase/feruloyl esterase family alpha/beta hydrolase [Stellaceae bacterium]|nr:tannase/feruloyl esterase family alpha/beta hydrolase [Stellaceae bacterium]